MHSYKFREMFLLLVGIFATCVKEITLFVDECSVHLLYTLIDAFYVVFLEELGLIHILQGIMVEIFGLNSSLARLTTCHHMSILGKSDQTSSGMS